MDEEEKLSSGSGLSSSEKFADTCSPVAVERVYHHWWPELCLGKGGPGFWSSSIISTGELVTALGLV